VIAAIRAIDPDNLIVVDTPNWSQDVDVAENNPITGYANVAYILHFYAGSYGQSLRDKATAALNINIPLFVTEWGSVNADGSGSVATSQANAWKTYLQTNNLRNANWSINDKPKRFRDGGWRKLNRELGRLPVNSKLALMQRMDLELANRVSFSH